MESIGERYGSGTIVDDDLPAVTINDVTVTEGDGGAKDATFTVELSGATSRTVTVDFATADGTATAGQDYVATTGTLGFAPGVTSRIVVVLVVGDMLVELDET